MAGENESPTLWLTLIVLSNAVPPLTLFLSKISRSPDVLSCHITKTLLPATAISEAQSIGGNDIGIHGSNNKIIINQAQSQSQR